MPASGRSRAPLSRFSTTTPPPSRVVAGLVAGLDEANGFTLTTSRIALHARPCRMIDSAGDGFLLGRAGPTSGARRAVDRRVGPFARGFGVCGAACLMPRSVFKDLGGFDEDFFFSHEDVDLSYRARLLGYRCRYVATATVRHYGGGTLGKDQPVRRFFTVSATSMDLP